MADSVSFPSLASAVPARASTLRHTAIVRVTHWITALCFLALLVTGIEILISHPRFYWGEAGNALMPSLFDIPIPASRSAVKTGYNYTLPDQNGWSRSLHFQAGWLAVLTGCLYGFSSLLNGHVRKNLLPGEHSINLNLSGLGLQTGNYVYQLDVLDAHGRHRRSKIMTAA